ncbi:MAG: DNA mismatch repair protein MutS [Betaproteobacteria bacterium]|nr:MAG: DNA mismatch repair protein MutS [Betaproteobacteria bacterium]
MRELLLAALADVTPLPQPNRVRLARPRPLPIAVQRQRDEHAVLHDTLSDAPAWELGLETGEELLFLRDGLSPQTLKKLRRGHWVIQDHLDLHGLTVPEARVLTAAFLAQCVRRGVRCVRIVHGKGLGSPNREPVLKKKVAGWLAQRDEVLAYCQAPQADGGGGAVLVLLRGSRSKSGA